MRAALYLLAGLVVLAVTAMLIAPAQWAAGVVSSATQGRIELAESRGTVWSGSAVLVLTSGSDAGAARASLPERLSWQLSPWSLLVGQVDLTLSHPSALAQPLAIRAPLFGGSATLGATTLRLPASLLVGLGAPWNTIRPGGILMLSWDRLQIEHGRIAGNFSAEWQQASSALTPVSPMGHYRLKTNGVWPGTQLDLLTISGPLELKGSGTIPEGGRLRFTGRAQALAGTDPGVKAQLTGLISLLGRRDGDGALLNFGGG
ncbi:MAG TPA: type II secretion system protein N [Burkholderiaceae bacterium]|nr:type II secretion system protein N [Burkholderiaceae bacterium]